MARCLRRNAPGGTALRGVRDEGTSQDEGLSPDTYGPRCGRTSRDGADGQGRGCRELEERSDYADRKSTCAAASYCLSGRGTLSLSRTRARRPVCIDHGRRKLKRMDRWIDCTILLLNSTSSRRAGTLSSVPAHAQTMNALQDFEPTCTLRAATSMANTQRRMRHTSALADRRPENQIPRIRQPHLQSSAHYVLRTPLTA
ncbi:hypothetical protein BD414DRAFT_117245 [Trametes punicea]|nr:hypothetical protein BD414DRAFT_117245 [Trametes punicea]